jgi:hypothetical protein
MHTLAGTAAALAAVGFVGEPLIGEVSAARAYAHNVVLATLLAALTMVGWRRDRPGPGRRRPNACRKATPQQMSDGVVDISLPLRTVLERQNGPGQRDCAAHGAGRRERLVEACRPGPRLRGGPPARAPPAHREPEPDRAEP